MDIRLERGLPENNGYLENYSRKALDKFFAQFDFLQSINIFFRGSKHPIKKIKIKAHLKGKVVFVESSAEKYPMAIDAAVQKLKTQITKYKSQRYS